MVVYERGGAGVGWQNAVQRCRSHSERRQFMKGVSSAFVVLAFVCLATSAVSVIWEIWSGKVTEPRAYVPLYGAVAGSLTVLVWWRIKELRRRWDSTSFSHMADFWKEEARGTE
jgi:hypothetical protein